MATRLEQEAVARYQALIAALPDMLHLIDKDGRFLDTYPGSVTPYCPVEQYLGKTVWEVFPESFAREVMQHIRDTLETDQVQEWEYALPTLEGSMFEARMVSVRVAQVKSNQVFVIIRDITKKRALERDLQASEQRFRKAFDASPNPKALSDFATTKFLRVNPAFCALMGYTEEELIGQTFEMLTYPEDLASSKDWVAKSRLQKVEDPVPFLRKRYRRKNGSIVWGETSVALLREFDETPTHFLVQVRDITTVLQTQSQLEWMVGERTRQLQASNDALQSFAYAASHDLREPLNKITAFGMRISEKYSACMDPKGQQYLEIMQDAAQRMTRLIDDLLEFSRAGAEVSPPVEVDLNEILSDVLSDLELPITESQAMVELTQLPTIIGHPARLRQVFQNLLSNALKFRQPNREPRIHVSGWVEDGKAILKVKDNGIGFDSQYAERIFTVFTRLHTRFEYPGTGIGLALCRRILDQYGGKISAQGVPNEGATFTVVLPVTGTGHASGAVR